jgi:hypothetical protein
MSSRGGAAKEESAVASRPTVAIGASTIIAARVRAKLEPVRNYSKFELC